MYNYEEHICMEKNLGNDQTEHQPGIIGQIAKSCFIFQAISHISRL